jgi:carbon-monoxide dehydrogenase small subunit
MNVQFSLNGSVVSINTVPGERLSTILRERFHLKEIKCGCLQGFCGSCAVIWNGAVSASCLIPAFRLNGAKIITMESFSRTDNYKDIATGFAQVPVKMCGFCDGAKYLTAESILAKYKSPTRDEICSGFAGVHCICTNPDALVDGVLAAAKVRKRRLYERRHE